MRIFSGVQPTGELHIGNYLGALKQWLELQDTNDCIFCIVDLHALTVPQNPTALCQATITKAIEYSACGLNPEKCIIFVQSHIKEHTELAWILNTITPIAELERMTQYKDKAKKQKQNVNAGLFTYPTLMAADILLYKTNAVPVGQDQSQHVELARTIARKFNASFGNVFEEPELMLPKEGARIMSLKDPKKKMSKSDSPQAFLSLFEEPESIRKKLMRATTDKGKEIVYNPKKKPGISNLLTIYSLFAEESLGDAEKRFRNKGYAFLKRETAELLVDRLAPFRRKKKELLMRDLYVKEILKTGARKARVIAQATMEEVRSKVGLLSV